MALFTCAFFQVWLLFDYKTYVIFSYHSRVYTLARMNIGHRRILKCSLQHYRLLPHWRQSGYLLVTLARLDIEPNRILCSKIRFSPSAWSLYKDCHPLAQFMYKFHWWELSNEVLYETFRQWAPEIPKVKLLLFWNLVNKMALSWNFWLWLVIILISFEIKLHAVPHLKALLNG